MKAAIVADTGVEIRDVPMPEPGPEEVVVRVHATGLNRAELAMAAGHRHGSMGGSGTVLGMEWAGEVSAVGSAVREVRAGDRVMCSGGGGHAEYAKTDIGRVATIPANNMSYEQAATLPIALQTMHDAVVTNGALARGQSVLIQGASSGVGLMGLRIARLMGAGLVIGTSTNAERRARLAEFGADLALDSSSPDWADEVLRATDGRGVDLIVDQVSGPVANQNLKATAILGRIVNVGRLGGASAPFDFDLHAMRRITYVGVTFRSRSLEEVREINRRMKADLWEAVENGTLSLPIDKVFPLSDIRSAHAHMRGNGHLGKIILQV